MNFHMFWPPGTFVYMYCTFSSNFVAEGDNPSFSVSQKTICDHAVFYTTHHVLLNFQDNQQDVPLVT